MRGLDGHGGAGLRRAPTAHPYPGQRHGRLQAVLRHLHPGPALCLLLQHRHRHLLRPGRLQNPLSLFGLLLGEQYRHGHLVCGGPGHGGGRRGLGHLSVPGGKLYSGDDGGVPPFSQDRDRDPTQALLLALPGRAFQGSGAQYFAAELYLGGQHYGPGGSSTALARR